MYVFVCTRVSVCDGWLFTCRVLNNRPGALGLGLRALRIWIEVQLWALIIRVGFWGP